jgi:protein phosphatase
MHVSWAALSHPGLRRGSNEDSYGARPDLGLFVVADGMGGHAAGEVASRLAVGAVEGFAAETNGFDRTRTWPFPYETLLSLESNRLKAAFLIANRRIADTMARTEGLRGMATTCSAILIGARGASVAHVGDSRLYRLRRGALEQVTRDHSWVEEQVRAGTLTPSAAREHPWRNIVTRALAGGEDPEIDVTEPALEAGDRVLLCTDGLHGVVSDARIAEIAGGAEPLETICQILVAEANAAGGPDNITVLVLQLDAD